MKAMLRNKFSVRQLYLFGGILFGLAFPVFAITFDCLLHDYPFTLDGIVQLHCDNPIHFIVDMAPLILAISFFLLGRTHDRKNSANQHLIDLNESLDAFTYKLTHDLKKPAANIKGLISLLRTADIDQENRELLLGKVDESVDLWLETFQEFTNILKDQKEGIKERHFISLNSTLQSVIKILSHDIEESAAQVHIDCPHNIFGTKDDLMSIFRNLLSNSLKYAHKERVPMISVSSQQLDDKVRIMFDDNGVGIDIDHEEKVFEKFHRANDQQDIEGDGIGLFLVKNLVESNEGHIDLKSKVGEGTTFVLDFPMSLSKN